MIDFPAKIEKRFKSLVEKHGLSSHYRSLRRELRPGFSIIGTEQVGGRGTSRFGGVPDVPSDFEWPSCRLGNLLFVAQINLSELPTHVDALPREGYMLFFSGWEGGNSKVFWYPSVPHTLLPAKVPELDSFTPGLGLGPIFSERVVSFEPSVHIPPIHPLRCEDDEFWEQHYDLDEALSGKRDSRLLGYSYYDPVEAGIEGGFSQWETLLQVDSFAPCKDMLWGDNGKLAFLVRKGCVKRRAFGRVTSCILGAG